MANFGQKCHMGCIIWVHRCCTIFDKSNIIMFYLIKTFFFYLDNENNNILIKT